LPDAGGGFGTHLRRMAKSQDAAKVGNILSLYAEQHNFLIGQSCCQVFAQTDQKNICSQFRFANSILMLDFILIENGVLKRFLETFLGGVDNQEFTVEEMIM